MCMSPFDSLTAHCLLPTAYSPEIVPDDGAYTHGSPVARGGFEFELAYGARGRFIQTISGPSNDLDFAHAAIAMKNGRRFDRGADARAVGFRRVFGLYAVEEFRWGESD